MMASSTLVAALFLAGAAIAGAAQQPAQGGGGAQGRGGQPPAPTNLQVLPKDIPRQELISTMRAYAFALGVQCNYCHVQEGQGGRNDMASDEKQPKKTARVMMQMVQHANEMVSTGTGKPAANVMKVECYTCHRGKAIPEATPPTPAPAPPAGGGAAPTTPGR
jgi:hypothetical protein